MLLRRGGARRDRVLAVGREAADLLGRAPAGVRRGPAAAATAWSPIWRRPGCTCARSCARRDGAAWSLPVRAVIGVPVGSTALEHRALLEAAEEAGIRPVTALDESIAGAVGCGIDPLERRVHMVVDVGGGTAEAVAFCFGGVLAHRTSKLAGDEMTLAVARYLREQHQLHVGELEAEELKIRVRRRRRTARSSCRAATPPPAGRGWRRCRRPRWPRPCGRSPTRSSGRSPPAWTTSPRRRSPTCWPRACWCSAGPRRSMGFPQQLERSLGLPVKLAEQPLTCVAEGAARALRNRRAARRLRPELTVRAPAPGRWRGRRPGASR